MKVLWLTNTPVGASEYLKIKYPAGGWMSSLETYVKEIDKLSLAVCFFYEGLEAFKFIYNSVTYYPIESKQSSLFSRINSKLFGKLYDCNNNALLRVIEDFKPDVIQLFGTESGFGEILDKVKIPVIIHIQGLMNPIFSAWLPKGISQRKIIFNSSIKEILLKKGVINEYYLTRKRATREEFIIKKASYFFGRTEWDKRVIQLYNKDATYFHCAELLRPAFFSKHWAPRESPTLNLVTTINPNIYKGLDIILETAFLLKKKSVINFQWIVIGVEQNSQLVRLFERIKKKKFSDNNVSFKGFKSTDELIVHLLESSIFIHPSHIDNSPNSMCEAMLLGMPVIATHVGGIPSLIEHNFNGLLYNSYDPFELAGTIIENANNHLELKRLGNNARITATKRHDATTIISTIIKTYASVLSPNYSK